MPDTGPDPLWWKKYKKRRDLALLLWLIYTKSTAHQSGNHIIIYYTTNVQDYVSYIEELYHNAEADGYKYSNMLDVCSKTQNVIKFKSNKVKWFVLSF